MTCLLKNEITWRYVIRSEYADVYGHLNNSRHPYYFDLSRIALQEQCGLKEEELKKRGIALVVKKLEINYIMQAYANQEIQIDSVMGYEGGAKLKIKHRMYSEKGQVAEAETTHCFIDLKTNKPIRPPKELVMELY